MLSRTGYWPEAGGLMWVEMQARILRGMDALAVRRGGVGAKHLATGEEGEREALFYLRRQGYTIVARRWKTAKLWGDVDLVGWDGEWLCFVEVKTRSGREVALAESAVDGDKQEMMRRMAKVYLRSFPEKLRGEVKVRFDVVSVYLLPSGVQYELYRGAFGW